MTETQCHPENHCCIPCFFQYMIVKARFYMRIWHDLVYSCNHKYSCNDKLAVWYDTEAHMIWLSRFHEHNAKLLIFMSNFRNIKIGLGEKRLFFWEGWGWGVWHDLSEPDTISWPCFSISIQVKYLRYVHLIRMGILIIKIRLSHNCLIL